MILLIIKLYFSLQNIIIIIYISTMEGTSRPNLLSGDLLDELCHKLRYLCKSQDELLEYLAANPDDSDIKDAINENFSSMKMLRIKINIIKSELPDSDTRKHIDFSSIDRSLQIDGNGVVGLYL
jgi:hypothetical protein